MPPFSALSTAPREEGKMAFPRQPFSLFFLNPFEFFGVVLADLGLRIKWAGLPFFLLGLGLGWWLKAISSCIFGPPWTTGLVRLWTLGGSPRCWALDPWWITEVLGFGPLVDHWGVGLGLPWTEKMGLYTVKDIWDGRWLKDRRDRVVELEQEQLRCVEPTWVCSCSLTYLFQAQQLL